MKAIGCAIVLAAVACAAVARAEPKAPAASAGPVIQIDDVERFYRIFDAAQGHPTAEQLQRDYLDPGSDGLHVLAKARNVTGQRIADAIAKQPALYESAKRCLAALPRVRQRLQAAMQRLGELYPEARFPPVTIAVGRGKPVAIGGPADGVQVGLEALCAADEDRFVHVIAHEYAHVQQSAVLADEEHPTVLQASLAEGGAEFIAELISGEVSNSHVAALAKGRELEIETAFVPDEDKTDLSKWLYNHPGTAEWPPDLGYWVGYRITKAYYQHAADKRQALREIFGMTDPKAFLARSGWRPGMRLD
jgi:hypothetical protein